MTALLDVYGVYNEKARGELVDLASNAWRINQWEPGFGFDHPGTSGNEWVTIDHWWVQTRAEELRVYTAGLIPPLVRTRDYAETIIRHTESNAARVDHQVRRLGERQLVLDEKPPKRLVAIIEESVLSRPMGGWAVLEQQLEYLLGVAERPHVRIHVLPTSVGCTRACRARLRCARCVARTPPVAMST